MNMSAKKQFRKICAVECHSLGTNFLLAANRACHTSPMPETGWYKTLKTNSVGKENTKSFFFTYIHMSVNKIIASCPSLITTHNRQPRYSPQKKKEKKKKEVFLFFSFDSFD